MINLLSILVNFPVPLPYLNLQLIFKVLVVLHVGVGLVVSIYYIANSSTFVVLSGPTLEVLVVVLNIDVALRI